MWKPVPSSALNETKFRHRITDVIMHADVCVCASWSACACECMCVRACVRVYVRVYMHVCVYCTSVTGDSAGAL